jgi:hypothetical protein
MRARLIAGAPAGRASGLFLDLAGNRASPRWLIATFIGVSLIFAGVARISVALGFRRAEHVLAPAHGGAHA